jgi:site-specific recombinase XerD
MTEAPGAEFITSELALRWAMELQLVQRATWARRLGMVRRFAAWLSTVDARTEVPAPRLLAARRRRNKPHIFTEQEIGRLMAEAAHLASPTGLRALTYTTLIGLLAATGLRPGEALALNTVDVDLENRILAIRQTKFGKSRFVPVADSTRAALVDYARHRDELCPHRPTEAFLVSERGRRLQGCTVRRTFARMSCAVGLRTATGSRRIGPGPRLQDFRHRFATRKLIEWYRAGLDVGAGTPKARNISGSRRCQPHLLVSGRPFRNSSDWPRSALAGISRELSRERFQPSVPRSAFLHRAIAEATRCKPAHHISLPGRLQTIAPVRL